MSDRLSLGEFTLEITASTVVVRDARGAVIETLDLAALGDGLTLPDGRHIDLAAMLADQSGDPADFQTAAGPTGEGVFGPASGGGAFGFRGMQDAGGNLIQRGAAGTLGGTSLQYGTITGDVEPTERVAAMGADRQPGSVDQPPASEVPAPPPPESVPVTWSSHDGWQVEENQSGGALGPLLEGEPADYVLTVSDPRFEIVDGVLQVRPGIGFDHETEPFVDVTVTATSRTGETGTQIVRVDIADVNEAQTALDLDGRSVVENAPGAIIGTLSVADPDAGDSQSFAVSDNRFEVVDGQLKLKDGVALDFESEPVVNVTVTATDKGGHTISEQFTLGVGDVNEAQTALALDGSSIPENAPGAIVGTLSVADPDAGDSQSFSVSDNRFEVVDGQLKLRDGVSLDHEAEDSIDVTVTATDQGGHAIQETFTVQVSDVNEAPTVSAVGGSVDNHIVNTTVAFQSTSNAVGDYLLSGANGTDAASKFGSAQINGIDPRNVTIAVPTEVTVTFQREGAGYHNMIGVYQFDDAGKIIPGSVQFVWLDATAKQEGQLGSALAKNFLGHQQAGTVSLGMMPAGTHLGFFTIADGASNSANQTILKALAGGGNQAAAMAAINSQLSIIVDGNGNGRIYAGGKQLAGDTYFTHDKTLNTDLSGGSDIQHSLSGTSSSLEGKLIVGFEDLNGGGDRDYEDVVFSVSMGSYNVNKMTQSVVQPNVDFSDIDSAGLSQAVIHTSGFQAGDTLNVPPSAQFDVSIHQNGSDYTIAIAAKTGDASIGDFESFVNSIYFSTSSKAEGERHIDYAIVDEGGLSSNVASAEIDVSNSYEISSSQIAAKQNLLGSGDDHLYLNSHLTGTLDFGTGHDTLHIAKNNDSLGHSDFVKMDNVEAIDMTGFGSNKVALSIVDVLDMTDGDHRLTVVGDKGDTVTLSGDNSGHHWQVVSSDAEFTTYAWSDPVHQAVVEISNQLTANLST